MTKFENGDLTCMAWDRLLELDVENSQDEIPGREYFDANPPGLLFREGLEKRLRELGYNGPAEDTREKLCFLKEQFRKNGVPLISDATLTNWLTRSASPRTNQPGREKLFRLCFALELDAVGAAEFMLKSCLCRPFNYKNAAEAAYFYCLSTGKGYADARRILERVNAADRPAPEETEDTEQIGQGLAGLCHEEDVVEYLAAHTCTREQWHSSARREIEALLKSCKESARYDSSNLLERDGMEVQSNDALLNIIYGFAVPDGKKEELPEALRDRWVDKMSLSSVLNGKDVSDEVYRKVLILLSFYHFYASLYKEKGLWQSREAVDVCDTADVFSDELDLRLAECGYVQLYARNPFDWLILYCASFPDPLRKFRDLIGHYSKDE